MFQKKNIAKSIGIIGGADGPTAIYFADKKNNEDSQWIEQMASTIQPCKKSIHELELYLINHYHAKEIELSENKRKYFKASIVESFYPELLKSPIPDFNLNKKSSQEEIEEFLKIHDKRLKEARAFPEKRIPLDIKAYEIPLVVDSIFNATVLVSIERYNEVTQFSHQIERHHETTQLSDEIAPSVSKNDQDKMHNIFQTILNDIILFQGVSQKDIDERSPCFMQYIQRIKK